MLVIVGVAAPTSNGLKEFSPKTSRLATKKSENVSST